MIYFLINVGIFITVMSAKIILIGHVPDAESDKVVKSMEVFLKNSHVWRINKQIIKTFTKGVKIKALLKFREKKSLL